MIDSTSSREPKELAHRVNNGIEVALLWFASTNRVVVRLSDDKTGERFELAVAGADALDAFYHPFAHAAWNGSTTRSHAARTTPGLDMSASASSATSTRKRAAR